MPWQLLFANLRAHPIRTLLTLGSLTAAIFLVCFLSAVIVGLEAGVNAASDSRLIVQSAVSLFVELPQSYEPKIEQVEGVRDAMKQNWFGGIYKEPSNFFAQFAVDHESFYDVYPEAEIVEGDKQAFLRKRTGAIIGTELARKYGFKVGDRVPIIGTIYPRTDGKAWEFEVVAIYKPAKASFDAQTMFFRFDYLQESLEGGAATGPRGAGIFTVALEPGADLVKVSKRIDTLFENGPQRVQTTTEAEFQRQFLSMLGSVPTFLSSIGGGVLFAIFLAALNTMLISARQRTRDFGIMKALGFGDDVAFALLMFESLLVCSLGGAIGIGLAKFTETYLGQTLSGMVPNYTIRPETMGIGFGVAVAIGVFAGLLPAIQASRLNPVQALRKEV